MNRKLQFKITKENAEYLIKIGQSLRGQISWNKNKKKRIKTLRENGKKRWSK